MSRPRNPRRPAGLLLPRPSVALLLSLFLLGSALSTAPRPLDAQLAAWPGAGGSGQEEALTLERLFASPEFFGERFGPARWLDGDRYTTLEPSRELRGGMDLVAYRAATGERKILVSASNLVPPGRDEPLTVEGYRWSRDGSKLLIFTNTRRVWRTNTRGDYWVLDLEGEGRHGESLFQLGGDAPEATLMFAKFSPDGRRVAYVRQNDIHVEALSDGRITPITTDGSRTTINGTFDWVYEEEFSLQDGFRWSPDGRRIAYWQLDASGVRDFLLINNTDSLYSFTIPVQYPKAGTTNSAARVGVVSSTGGETVWMELEGDPRNHYPARMDWAASSDQVVIQYLNRLQNRLELLLGQAETGAVRAVLTETDEAWVEVVDDLVWLDEGRSFTWVSEADGWRRVYRVDREDGHIRPLTPPDEDILSVVEVDEEGGWLYFTASPDDPKRAYLFRVPLDPAPEAAERLTPADAPGVHGYQVAPGAGWAIHTASTFDTPPVISLVALPNHRQVRTLVDNRRLRERLASVRTGSVEFFRIAIDEGLELDGWMMKPDDFDPDLSYPVLTYVYGQYRSLR